MLASQSAFLSAVHAILPRKLTKAKPEFVRESPSAGEVSMNQDTLKEEWSQLRDRVRKRWGKLTIDDLDQIQGDSEMLVGKLQERYGRTRPQVERWFGEWSV
jgi:uncharacterized protein YjbJ (UPF0337 family)